MSDTDVQSVLSSYKSDENPDEYSYAYNQLKGFINTSLDAYKVSKHNHEKLLYSNSGPVLTDADVVYFSMKWDKSCGPSSFTCT
jgi:hypothetical protein